MLYCLWSTVSEEITSEESPTKDKETTDWCGGEFELFGEVYHINDLQGQNRLCVIREQSAQPAAL